MTTTLSDEDVDRIAVAIVERLRGLPPAPQPQSSPITTWRAVAEALGVSEQTVHRRRRGAGDTTKKPHFDDIAGARRWWGRIIGRAPVPTTSPASSRRPSAHQPAGGTTLADLKAKKKAPKVKE